MEFDTGPDVPPGHDITIDTSSGSTDLGQATYDSDHDGVADSVIVIDGDHEYVFTDSDHDGTADSVHEYNSTGHEIDPKTGAPLDGAGDGSSSQTGTGTDAGNTTGAADHTGGTGSTSGTDHTAGTGTAGTDSGTSDHTGTGSSSSAGGLTVTGDDGSAHSLGVPTIDMDKDGSPDTAVVHNADGSVTGYTDRDGDGKADQITQVGSDGKVVIAVADGHGGWEVAATGHLDSSGSLVQDSTPSPSAGLDGTDSDGVTTHHTGTSSGTTGTSSGTTGTSSGTTGTSSGKPGTSSGTTADHPQADPTDHTGAGTTGQPSSAGPAHEPIPDSAPISGNAPAGDITFTEGGKEYDLGHPTTDLNGDGTPDTVVTHLPDGTVVGYSDTDGDGTADQVTQISPDGQVVIGVSDGHGGWEQAATGHLDPDGKFVPDASAAGVSAGSPTG